MPQKPTRIVFFDLKAEWLDITAVENIDNGKDIYQKTIWLNPAQQAELFSLLKAKFEPAGQVK